MRSKDIETLESNFWAKAKVWLFCMQVGKWGFDWRLWFSVSGQIKGWWLSPGDGWIVLSFLSALKNPSMVVLDNASYHNVKTEDTVCPNFSQKKAVLQNYLTQHNIPFSATDTKKVWYGKIKQKKTPVAYKTVKIANLHG